MFKFIRVSNARIAYRRFLCCFSLLHCVCCTAVFPSGTLTSCVYAHDLFFSLSLSHSIFFCAVANFVAVYLMPRQLAFGLFDVSSVVAQKIIICNLVGLESLNDTNIIFSLSLRLCVVRTLPLAINVCLELNTLFLDYN